MNKIKVADHIRFRLTIKEWMYLIKCLTGAMFCYSFFFILPDYPIQWSLISAVIVLSPDNDSQLAYNRIKSNILGGLIGFALYALPLPNMALLGIGIALVILIAYFLKIENTIRSAMAALVVVLVEQESTKDWLIPFERIISVFIGCIVALFITFLFSFFFERKQQEEKAEKPKITE